MKSLIFSLLFIFSSCFIFAQIANIPVDEDTKLITWQEVVNENGEPIVLYNRCIEWINTEYKNSQEVTKVRDPEGGRIVIQHRIRLFDKQEDGSEIASNTVVNYVLRLEFRENRFRYTFSEFTMKAQSKYPLERWLDKTDPTYHPKYEDYLVQVEKTVKDIIERLKTEMKEKVVKEDVW